MDLAKTWDKMMDRLAFDMKTRADFYSDVAHFINAGIAPFDCLSRIHAVLVRRKRARLARIYGRMSKRLQRGDSLDKAFAPEIPRDEAAMLAAAAQGGDAAILQVLKALSDTMQRRVVIASKMRGVMIEAGGGGAAIVGLAVMMMVSVVPELTTALSPQARAQLGFANYYFAFGHALVFQGPYVLVIGIALSVWSRWSLPRWFKKRDYWSREWCDRHLPPWTLYVRTQTSSFLTAIATMMRSGIPMKDTLIAMVPTATPWLKNHLRKMIGKLDGGVPEMNVLGTSFIPRDTSDRLSIYASLNDVADVVRHLADENFESYSKYLDKLRAVARTCVTLGLGLFTVATLFAMFQFAQAVRTSVKM